MEQMYPDVSNKLAEHGLNITFRAPTWFLCMFFTSLKSEVVVRAWDLIFFNSKSCVEGAAGSAALCCLGLGIVDSVQPRILAATNISECAIALQQASDHIVDARDLMRRSFREIMSVAGMARKLSSTSVKGKLRAARLKLQGNRRGSTKGRRAPPASARRPKRKRGHRRSLSDGDMPFALQQKQQQHAEEDYGERPGPDKSPRTNARLMSKRRRVFREQQNTSSSTFAAPTTRASSTATSAFSNGFASFKRWLTPKKTAAPGAALRRGAHRMAATAKPAGSKFVSRLDFGSETDVAQMLMIKPDSEQRKMVVKHQQAFSHNKKKVRHSALQRVRLQQQLGGGADSPRGHGVQLKQCTTPAHIRRDSQVATRYTPPPEAPMLIIAPPCVGEGGDSICAEDLEDIL